MSYIKNPHSDEPFTDLEGTAYTADRLRKHQIRNGDAIPAGTLKAGDQIEVTRRRPGADPDVAMQRMVDAGRALQETITAQAGSIASQARLIAAMSEDAIRGRKAADAMLLLGVRLGINPVPTDPEEFTAAILSVMDKLRAELSSTQEG